MLITKIDNKKSVARIPIIPFFKSQIEIWLVPHSSLRSGDKNNL
jgi:hypothetical protein